MTNLTNLTNLKKLSTLSTIVSSAIGAAYIIADKVDERNRTIRRGYQKVHASSMACNGLKLGEFCTADNFLCIHILPEDMKSNLCISSFCIEDRISNITCDIDAGFYAVNVNGKIRRTFFDGNNFLILGKDAEEVKVNRKVDLETYDLVNEVAALRKQTNKAVELEAELKALRKQVEVLTLADAEKAARIKELEDDKSSIRRKKNDAE